MKIINNKRYKELLASESQRNEVYSKFSITKSLIRTCYREVETKGYPTNKLSIHLSPFCYELLNQLFDDTESFSVSSCTGTMLTFDGIPLKVDKKIVMGWYIKV